MARLCRVMATGLLGLGLLALGACGSDDDGEGGGSCGDVCGCVVAAGGDAQTCQDECSATVQAGGNQRASCEAKLDSFGYPQCKNNCAGFPTG
jgi:hypothetical protein